MFSEAYLLSTFWFNVIRGVFTHECMVQSMQVHAGDNVGLGKDYTLYALIDGIVHFHKNSKKHSVNVIPFDQWEVPEGQRLQEGSRVHKKRQAAIKALEAAAGLTAEAVSV